MSEPQTINLKDLMESVKSIKESLASLQPADPKPKGKVEESVSDKTQADTKVKARKAFKEFLQDDKRSTFSVSEEIGGQTSTAAIPTIWTATPELLSPAGADGYFLTPIVTWKNDIKGSPGNVVNVQTIAPVAAFTFSSGTEGTTTAATIATVPVTLTQPASAFYISKADLEDIQDGTLDLLIQQSKNAVLRAVDAYFLTQLQVDAAMAAAGTVAEAGAMAATVLAKMWGSLMAGSYKPAAVFMHPVQYASLLRDSQFTNAATRGKSSIIETGEIGNYLGMDIVPLVQGTLAAAAGGTYRAFMVAQGALVGAIKRELDVEKEYYVKDQRNYVVVSTRFGGTPVHTNGIGKITTVNG